MNEEDIKKYDKSYSEEGLWDKLAKFANKIGLKAVYKVLLLYTTLIFSENISNKIIILGALGYFILPFDMIPDFLPGGFVDDISIVSSVLSSIPISNKIKKEAKKILHDLMEFDDSELEEL